MPIFHENKKESEKAKIRQRKREQETADSIAELFTSLEGPQKSGRRKLKPSVPRPRTAGPGSTFNSSKVRVVETLTKAHQMEGDGLLLLLYYQLFKKTWNSRKEFQSCPGARCPETVVYEHNFPQHWYYYDPKHGEMFKRPGSYLDTSQILKYFSRPVAKDFEIVAQYLCTQENPETEEIETSVEFFTAQTLKEFLGRSNRPDGVLQRFVIPKGEHNFQIQAVWSPKVTLVYKRTNMCRLKDKSVGIYTRAVTCDGPPHFSREDLLAEKTQSEVVKICNNFVQHFSSTEHKPVSRVVLYFKVDENDNLWIIWASSLRIGTTKFSSSQQRIPLNLSTKFTTPEAEQQRRRENCEGIELERKLVLSDVEQYRLSSDIIFATNFCTQPYSQGGAEGVAPPPKRGYLNSRQPFKRIHTAPHTGALMITDRSPKQRTPCGAAYVASPVLSSGTRDDSASPRRCDRRPGVPSERPPFLPSPTLNQVPPATSPRNPFHRKMLYLGLMEEDDSAAKKRREGEAATDGAKGVKAGFGSSGDDPLEVSDDNDNAWWKCTARIEQDYRTICANEERVRTWAQDELYYIYSHTLNHGLRKLYITKPAAEVWDVLCRGDYTNTRYADELIQALGLEDYEQPYEDEESNDGRPTFYYAGYGCSAKVQSEGVVLNPAVRQPSSMDRPVFQLRSDIDACVSRIFNEFKEDLRITIAAQREGGIGETDDALLHLQ
eukprot:TRINITY_DN32941_c0_g1_i1.p1 TRINITY_DN32941_c0_g1~~TRINITY_DN32941_c0_g1_i1.p1  ORF type:complete len:718 (+),score=184.68 TRINITY_DN32941_c0_g1_i1:79-2232(+)